jgi:hypothetical protein
VDLGGDEHGLACLEDLVQSGESDSGKILLLVDGVGFGHGLMEDVVDGADGEGVVEQVVEDLPDASKGTVADQNQGEDELAQPRLGDRQPEEQIIGFIGRGKGEIKTMLSLVELLVDELAADSVAVGESRDGAPRKGVEGQLAARQGVKLLGWEDARLVRW